jgi:hypothetical protein
MVMGETPQFLIDEGHQGAQGFIVALCPLTQQHGERAINTLVGLIIANHSISALLLSKVPET